MAHCRDLFIVVIVVAGRHCFPLALADGTRLYEARVTSLYEELSIYAVHIASGAKTPCKITSMSANCFMAVVSVSVFRILVSCYVLVRYMSSSSLFSYTPRTLWPYIVRHIYDVRCAVSKEPALLSTVCVSFSCVPGYLTSPMGTPARGCDAPPVPGPIKQLCAPGLWVLGFLGLSVCVWCPPLLDLWVMGDALLRWCGSLMPLPLEEAMGEDFARRGRPLVDFVF